MCCDVNINRVNNEEDGVEGRTYWILRSIEAFCGFKAEIREDVLRVYKTLNSGKYNIVQKL